MDAINVRICQQPLPAAAINGVACAKGPDAFIGRKNGVMMQNCFEGVGDVAPQKVRAAHQGVQGLQKHLGRRKSQRHIDGIASSVLQPAVVERR
jgi:hypothetical protein